MQKGGANPRLSLTHLNLQTRQRRRRTAMFNTLVNLERINALLLLGHRRQKDHIATHDCFISCLNQENKAHVPNSYFIIELN